MNRLAALWAFCALTAYGQISTFPQSSTGSGSGASLPSTSSLLKGNGSGGAAAATPKVDFEPPRNAIHLSDYASGSPSPTCSQNLWPYTGCVDETAQIQAAINAAANQYTFLIVDSPHKASPPYYPGLCYYATHIVMTRGIAGIVGQGFQYDWGGAQFCQIPSTNQDFFVSDPTQSPTGYIDYFLMDNLKFAGDPYLGVSTSGSGVVFNSHVGERMELRNVTAESFPDEGIKTARGSDPLTWNNIAAGGNGYGTANNGCGINLTKTGADPWNMVDIRGISGDNNAVALLCLHVGSGYYTTDTFHFSALKTESTSSFSGSNSPVARRLHEPYVVWLDGLVGGTPVNIDGLTAVVINGSSPINSVARTGCNGTSCTVNVSYASNNDYPAVGQNLQINGNSQSDLNQVCVVTAANPTSATCTQTTAGGNETGNGGNAFWNRQCDSLVYITGGQVPSLTISGVSAQGGTNDLGNFGFHNIIHETSRSVTVPLSIAGDSTTGGTFAKGTYFPSFDSNLPVFCFDNRCAPQGLGDVTSSIQVLGESYPRMRTLPLGMDMGTGSSLNTRLQPGASDGEVVVSNLQGAYGSGTWAAAKFKLIPNGADSSTWSGGSAAPSGSCTNGSMFSRGDTGAVYFCNSNSWVINGLKQDNTRTNIVGAGDSRMANSGSIPLIAGEDLLTQISLQPAFSGSVGVHNGAVPGAFCPSGSNGGNNMTDVYASNVYPYRPNGTTVTRSLLFILEGINDIAFGGSNSTDLVACQQAYINRAVADGFTPILITSFPRLDEPEAQDSYLVQYNLWLKSQPFFVFDMAGFLGPLTLPNGFYATGNTFTSASSFSISGNVLTVTFSAASPFSVGDTIYLTNFSNGFLNNAISPTTNGSFGLQVATVSGNSITLPFVHSDVTTTTDAGRVQKLNSDGLHLGPTANILAAKALANRYGLGAWGGSDTTYPTLSNTLVPYGGVEYLRGHALQLGLGSSINEYSSFRVQAGSGTNGNIVFDPYGGGAMYFGYDSGNGYSHFCNGAGTCNAHVSDTGLLTATGVQVGNGSGPTWTTGTAAPTGACSPNGSLYSESTTGDLYVCHSGAWVLK